MSFSTMTAQKFYRQVLIEAGRPSLEDAKRVTAGVFHTLRDRLTSNEADLARLRWHLERDAADAEEGRATARRAS